MIAGAEAFRVGISRAMDALARDQPAAAVAQLKPLLAINDRSYELHLFLGDAYTATRQFDNALGEYAAARLLNPRSAAPLLSAARAYLAQGDTARALQQANEAAAIEPGSGDVSVGARHDRRARRPDAEALADYTAAVQRQRFRSPGAGAGWPASRCGRDSSTSHSRSSKPCCGWDIVPRGCISVSRRLPKPEAMRRAPSRVS